MRVWNIDPKLLCNQHLLGEHFEIHCFRGSIIKNKSIKGYIEKGFVEVHNLRKRHNKLAEEIINRGMNHKSEFEKCKHWEAGIIDIQENLKELKKRCGACNYRIEMDETINILAKRIADIIDEEIINDIIKKSRGEINEDCMGER